MTESNREYIYDVDGPMDTPARQLRVFENEDPRGSQLRITEIGSSLFVSLTGKTCRVNHYIDVFDAAILRNALTKWLEGKE